MKQTQAIKKFIELNKEIKAMGYILDKQTILSNMEIYYLDLHIDNQIDWFINTPNDRIIDEMIENDDI